MTENSWINLNNQLMIRTPEGDFDLDKDKQAVKKYFLDHINVNTRTFLYLKEKIEYLIENDYWIDFLQYYSHQSIKKIMDFVYKKKFRFQSFMAAKKFYDTYSLKEKSIDGEGRESEKYLERYEDRIVCVALFLAKDIKGDVEVLGQSGIEKLRLQRAIEYAEIMINQEYQPATPTFLNAGKKRGGELVSCFLDTVSDNLPSIGYSIDSAMHLSSIGGGVAYNISRLRGRGEAIKGVSGRASGPLPVMKIMEDTFSYANQLGQRPGAGAVYLSVFHQDIEEFLDCKKINVDEKIRIKSLSIGVVITDKFMELAEKDEIFYVFGPHSIFQEYGQSLEDFDINNRYHELLSNPRIKKKKLNARQLLVKIAQVQKESGYPYIFYKDNTNRVHPLNNVGEVTFSNLCTEILQVSQESIINKIDRSKDEYNYGISCNLGSLNIATVMQNKRVEEVVRLATRSLTIVSDVSNIQEVPSIAKANRELHSIGLGAMNLHGYLAKNNIPYESEDAKEFCNIFFMMVNYWSLVESNQIAYEKKETFRGFEGSSYHTGEYFENSDYFKKDYTEIKSEKVQRLFQGIDIPTKKNWRDLSKLVQKHGLYNAYRLAIAPNQSTSYIMNSTASVMPIVDVIETREYGDSTTYYPMPYFNNINLFMFKSAYNMNQFKVLDLMAVIQKHIDQGVSCILHTRAEETTRDLARYYIYAWKIGLKTLYYTRTRKSSIDECISCSA